MYMQLSCVSENMYITAVWTEAIIHKGMYFDKMIFWYYNLVE